MPQKQAVTGRTKDNTAFPLTVQFTTISQNLSLGDLYSPSHSISTAASDVVSTCVCSKEREGVQPANEVCESGVVEPASRHSYTRWDMNIWSGRDSFIIDIIGTTWYEKWEGPFHREVTLLEGVNIIDSTTNQDTSSVPIVYRYGLEILLHVQWNPSNQDTLK